ncbi:hypothetical protein Dgeo_2926 (plasmid) [Deinococcus geothermalis DSM 11300]|uniref:Uncharacterized protein n=2 Tax=Deinococcus geothermalis TaxID=68909 RepID=A8ZR60_DEIGD|nr:hypothetical protein Dgeo_2926 [Deinococcus geothermalis DSM 11300]
MVTGERACTSAFTVLDWTWEDTHLRPVRLLGTPSDPWTKGAVVFCPREVTQADLRRRVGASRMAFDEATGQTAMQNPTATGVAEWFRTLLGLDVADTPLEIKIHALPCLDETRVWALASGPLPPVPDGARLAILRSVGAETACADVWAAGEPLVRAMLGHG